MKLRIAELDLQLLNPFGIARSTVSVRPVVLTELEGGYGEASPNPFYKETQQTCVAAIRQLGPLVESARDIESIEEIVDGLAATIPPPQQQSAKAALDIALHDRLARRLGVPLYKLLGRSPDPAKPMVTSYTIGIDTPEEMLRKTDEARQYKVIKVKIGRSLEQDLHVMREIRKMLPSHTLRVDANAGYTLDEARTAAKALTDLGVEYLEQPLAKGNFEELAKLHADCPLPIYVDEDSMLASDLPRLAGITDGINIKLMKSGGLVEARRMVALARTFGFRIMIGCMIETSVGIAAAAHLGSYADNLDLDGNLLIGNDPFEGLDVSSDGTITLSERPGLGVSLKANSGVSFS